MRGPPIADGRLAELDRPARWPRGVQIDAGDARIADGSQHDPLVRVVAEGDGLGPATALRHGGVEPEWVLREIAAVRRPLHDPKTRAGRGVEHGGRYRADAARQRTLWRDVVARDHRAVAVARPSRHGADGVPEVERRPGRDHQAV